MKPHEERVIQERDELSTKIDKLQAFIDDKTKFDELPFEEKDRLLSQLGFMLDYLKVLNERIAAFNPGGCPDANPHIIVGAGNRCLCGHYGRAITCSAILMHLETLKRYCQPFLKAHVDAIDTVINSLVVDVAYQEAKDKAEAERIMKLRTRYCVPQPHKETKNLYPPGPSDPTYKPTEPGPTGNYQAKA